MAKSQGPGSRPKQRSSRPLKASTSVFRRDSASASASVASLNPRRKSSGASGSTAAMNANAAGYAKRLERKEKKAGAGSSILDVYEYDGNGKGSGRKGLNRRANVGLDVDRDELVGQGGPRSSKFTKKSKGNDDESEEEENDEEGGAGALRRKIAANMEADFGVVESEDDESVDSDDAFEGESDEERFANFKFAEKVSFTKASVFVRCFATNVPALSLFLCPHWNRIPSCLRGNI